MDEPTPNPVSDFPAPAAGAGEAAVAEKPTLFIRAGSEHRIDGVAPKIEPYDFRNPAFLSEIELRRVRLVHEDFLRYLSARLSLFLRLEFGAKLARLGTQTYSKFTESLANPTHLCLFKAEPLSGVGIVSLSPKLALTMVDRLLGGRGQPAEEDRPLTEIEVGMLEEFVFIVLEEWARQWKPESPLRTLIIGHEQSGRFLQTSARDAAMLALTLDVTLGDRADTMQIGVPFDMVEPMVRRMQPRRQKDEPAPGALKSPLWQKCYDRISVPVRAEWEAFEVSLREVASLRVGDVLEMPAQMFQRTHLLLNGTRKFIGSVGLDNDRVAVQIAAQLPPEENELDHALAHARKST